MGPHVCQLLATLYVALSLALFALGGTDRTLSFSGPTIIVGPILDIVVVSKAVEGVICQE
jgi:hypothetical protein